MTPAKICKKHGITLTELVTATRYTAQNLCLMAKAHPHRLLLLVKGVAYDKYKIEYISLSSNSEKL